MIGFVITIGVEQMFACSCSSGFHGTTNWEVAKAEAQGTDVIFEGTPQHIEIQWIQLGRREGDLVPSFDGSLPGEYPRMMITFQVIKSYKGNLGSEVQVFTGLGGGDCGAIFSPGLTYLVYAQGKTQDQLGASLCSPGGWIGNSSVAIELRYLRREQPIPGDLRKGRQGSVKESAEQERDRMQSLEEQTKRYSSATGTICGRVVFKNRKQIEFGQVSFLSTEGYSPSPFAHSVADIRADGAFCSSRLAPGLYNLHFEGYSDGQPASSTYYPGVDDRAVASTIEITAGRTQSGILFIVPEQRTYAVRGFMATNDSAGLVNRNAYAVLRNLDGLLLLAPYQQVIDFEGLLIRPRFKYFHFDKVLPGRYIAFASGPSPDWFTKQVDLTVSTHSKFISLELIHKN